MSAPLCSYCKRQPASSQSIFPGETDARKYCDATCHSIDWLQFRLQRIGVKTGGGGGGAGGGNGTEADDGSEDVFFRAAKKPRRNRLIRRRLIKGVKLDLYYIDRNGDDATVILKTTTVDDDDDAIDDDDEERQVVDGVSFGPDVGEVWNYRFKSVRATVQAMVSVDGTIVELQEIEAITFAEPLVVDVDFTLLAKHRVRAADNALLIKGDDYTDETDTIWNNVVYIVPSAFVKALERASGFVSLTTQRIRMRATATATFLSVSDGEGGIDDDLGTLTFTGVAFVEGEENDDELKARILSLGRMQQQEIVLGDVDGAVFQVQPAQDVNDNVRRWIRQLALALHGRRGSVYFSLLIERVERIIAESGIASTLSPVDIYRLYVSERSQVVRQNYQGSRTVFLDTIIEVASRVDGALFESGIGAFYSTIIPSVVVADGGGGGGGSASSAAAAAPAGAGRVREGLVVVEPIGESSNASATYIFRLNANSTETPEQLENIYFVFTVGGLLNAIWKGKPLEAIEERLKGAQGDEMQRRIDENGLERVWRRIRAYIGANKTQLLSTWLGYELRIVHIERGANHLRRYEAKLQEAIDDVRAAGVAWRAAFDRRQAKVREKGVQTLRSTFGQAQQVDDADVTD